MSFSPAHKATPSNRPGTLAVCSTPRRPHRPSRLGPPADDVSITQRRSSHMNDQPSVPNRPSSRHRAPSVGLAAMLQVAVVALCVSVLATPASAADVPVIGVATGDATRGPLVDYLQRIGQLDLRTPGFIVIGPDQVAKRADEAATPPRAEQLNEDKLRQHMVKADRALDDSDWATARRQLITALSVLERDDGERILLGTEDKWVEARLELANAYLLDRTKRQRRKGEFNEEYLQQAKIALTPIFKYFPQYMPTSEVTPEVAELLTELRNALRRTGTLTVESSLGGADVWADGVKIGETPLEEYRLSVGTYEIQAGRADRPSRIHEVEIKAGETTSIKLDPAFEFDLTTDGYAIIEAPTGQSAGPSAVQMGSGVAALLDTRYALVFAVEGADPLLLYAALVDSESGVVVRERTVEVEPGPVNGRELRKLLLYAIEGKEIDDSWPAERYVWISGFVVSAGLLATSTYFFLEGASAESEAENKDQFTSDVEDFEKQAADNYTIGWIIGGVGAGVLGLTIYFLISDVTSEPESVADGGFDMIAGPTRDGGAVQVRWTW